MAHLGALAEHAGLPAPRRPFMPRPFRRQSPAERALPGSPIDRLTPPEARPQGCGWFDSSHDLNQGLQVTEHANPDTVAGDLPLSDWLRMQLSGWRSVEPSDV
jgi:hypothetical protein